MENDKKTKTVELPEDLQKRMEEAETPEDRMQVLRDFAALQGAEDPVKKEATYMTEEQFRQFLSEVGPASAEQAKAAIASAAEDVERKYNLNGDEARKIAEHSFSKTEQQQLHLRADMEIAAEVFRGMLMARQGKPDAYRQAIEQESDHYKKTYKRETRAMSLGTDSSGGYLAPQLFSDMLYENIARASLVRRYATIIPMKGNEVIKIPTMTASLTANQTSEAGSTDGSEPTFSQKQLATKKIVTKTNPVSVEMIEKANPAIIPLLLQFATIEILKKEDSLVFGTSGDGIRASSTNLVATGSAATGYSSVDFDDMIDLESELEPQYLPDDDIQGSGIITGVPRYWLPHALVQQLKKKKDGNGVYLDEARELRNERKIFGYDAKRALSLPDGSSLSSGDKIGVFGNLAHVWCGVEPGFRILIADQGVTDNGGGADVNLFDTAQVAVRVLEMFDNVVVDEEAFSIPQMGA